MKVENNIKIYDDNDNNINDRLCLFTYSYEIECHPLDGVYGVSGAERDPKDLYKKEVRRNIFGIYNQNENSIVTVYGEKISLLSNKLIFAKILNADELLKLIK